MIKDVEQLAAALPVRFRRHHLDKEDIRQHLALEILFFRVFYKSKPWLR